MLTCRCGARGDGKYAILVAAVGSRSGFRKTSECCFIVVVVGASVRRIVRVACVAELVSVAENVSRG